MRVFLTGASGFIGSAVIPQLISGGHQVVGLARSDAAAAIIENLGAEVLRGDLTDLESLRKGADASDGVIHLGFIHDWDHHMESVQVDLQVIEAIGQVLEGSDRAFMIASGIVGFPSGGSASDRSAATERDMPDPAFPRSEAAKRTLAMAEKGVRSVVVRFAPTVHGIGDKGFISMLVGIARDKGVSAYVGDGTNRWPAVHRLDAAQLVSLGFDKAPAGSVLNATADEGVPLRAIAEIIGRHLDLPVVSVAPDRAADHFGWLGLMLSIDGPTSNALTRELLAWHPTHPGLIDDLELGHYFSR